MFDVLLIALFVVMPFVISFLISAALVWILAMCFGFSFTWKLAVGLWIIYSLVKGIFSKKIEVCVRKNDKDED